MSESKHVRVFKEKHLAAGESVVASADGYTGKMMGSGKDAQQNGALLVTSKRVAFYRKGWLGEVLETIPIKSVTSVERRSTLGFHTIKFHTSHDSLEFKSLDTKDIQRIAEAVDAGRF